MPIREVTIAGVRGIYKAVRFELAGRSLLVHGDNGTGKSSFERALRWALRGEDEPTSDPAFTTEESFRRHVRADIADPAVTVTFTDGSSIAVRPGHCTTGGNGAAIRDACTAGQPFLRRTELLTVLGARPGDRFAYFEAFLGLRKVDALVEALGNRHKAVQGRASSLASRLNGLLDTLRVLLPARLGARDTVSQIDAAAAAWSRELLIQSTAPVDQARELKTRAESLASGDSASYPHRLDGAGGVLITARTTAEDLARRIGDLFAREEATRAALSDSADADLLHHAFAHFRRQEGAICPVCHQSVSWSRTRDALKARLDELQEFRQIQRELDEAATSLRRACETMQSAVSDILQIASSLGVSGTYSLALPALVATIAKERSTAGVLAAVRSAELVGAFAEVTRACESIGADLVRLKSLVPDVRGLPELQTAVAFYDKFAQARPGAEVLEREVLALDVESRSLTLTVEAFRRARQDVARETLTAIQDLVAEYYFKIHPPGTADDATGAPTIDVQRHGRGTAFVRGAFGGEEIKDPTWVYSDGHLDTVGLCIFLALRRFRSAQQGDPRLMVLDDVIISIDLGHSRRFLEVLKDSFGDHQVLILTHNGLFARWCRTFLPGMATIEIKGWSLENGPNVGDYTSRRERLDAALAGGTAKDIAGALMELLDEWTAEARYAYQVAVPAKVGEQYTLTDIWAPLLKRLRGLAKDLKSDLGGTAKLLERLKDVPDVRNALAGHYNEFAQEFPRSTIAGIATDVCRLIDGLHCPDCAEFVAPVGSYSSPSLMECPGHHKQYLATAGAVND